MEGGWNIRNLTTCLYALTALRHPCSNTLLSAAAEAACTCPHLLTHAADASTLATALAQQSQLPMDAPRPTSLKTLCSNAVTYVPKCSCWGVVFPVGRLSGAQ